MKIHIHEPDPMEADTSFPEDKAGVVMTVEPAFYGKSKSATAFVVSTSTNNGRPLGSYRIKVSDTGKLAVEDLGERRKLDIDLA
jgi:hypothetical protein